MPEMPSMTGPMWMPTRPPTWLRLLIWHPQPIPVFLVLCIVAAVLYLLGVTTLRRRSVEWPVSRTISFIVGLLLIVAVTSTGVGGYAMVLFSVHMSQHMVLNMVAPLFLLMGSPITLALRALPSTDPSRRALLTLLHSRFARVISHPGFTIPLFLVSLYGVYFTPALDWAMSGWLTHNLMIAHFVLVGLLFFWPIMGVDPSPRRRSHPVRIGELLLTLPFHAFFGISIMMSTQMLNTYFMHVPPGWSVNPIDDQYAGGGIAWAFSEVPTLIVIGAVFLQWVRSDDRSARRRDRQADRDDDAELTRYNERLAALARFESTR
ncbi:putative copper resistance protein D [Antricoccus suffuscus]|uniref:Putative copper resistance protein D n=1 Tax=Antricoccus suffuscus TaxID=1629062 RepID=A0A2T1A1W1_9ACTN|nr:cytochrome c oxidase assembly protein [Antricoccus suffuscus]PRZ42600.1 putative copper resistance protein D [Antricoccus suffuscus]